MNVLIVDDSKTMRLILLRTLRQAGFSQFNYKEASNGLEALSILREFPADLVISDWNMPDRNGIELLEEVRRRGIAVPFGFVSSNNVKEMRDQARAAGASFFLGKPFTVETLQEAVSPYMKG